jgi:hypothetical protein
MRTLFAIGLLAICSYAFAASKPEPALAVTEGDFSVQRAEIEKKLADGKTYSEISGGDRARVREALQRMGGELEGVGSIEDLDEPARVRLFNDQEEVNTILTQAASDSRIVCDYTTATGSRMKVSTCQTVAERNRRLENDQNEMRKLQRTTPLPRE